MVEAQKKILRMPSLAEIVIAVFTISAVGGYYYFSSMKPRNHSENVDALIQSLADKRPADMTPAQWACAVEWTRSLHENSLLISQTSTWEIAAFERRLREKLTESVDMQTIDWIWEEYANAGPAGKGYQRFKSQMLKEIEAAGKLDDSEDGGNPFEQWDN